MILLSPRPLAFLLILGGLSAVAPATAETTGGLLQTSQDNGAALKPSECTLEVPSNDVWAQLDYLCEQKKSELTQGLRGAVGDKQLVLGELVGFCEGRSGFEVPRFAGFSAQERAKFLSGVDLAVDWAEALAHLEAAKRWSPLVETLSKSLGNEELLKTGAGMDLVVDKLSGSLCTPETRPWLPATCSQKYDKQALLTLRENILRDLAALPHLALSRGREVASSHLVSGVDAAEDETALALRSAVAVLETALGSAHPHELAIRLARLAPKTSQSIDACGMPPSDSRAGQVSLLLLRMSREMPRLRALRDDFVPSKTVLEQAALGLAQLEGLETKAGELKAKETLLQELAQQREAAEHEARVALQTKIDELRVEVRELEANIRTIRSQADVALDAAGSCSSEGADCQEAQVKVLLQAIKSELVALGIIKEGQSLSATKLAAIEDLADSLATLEGYYAELRSGVRLSTNQVSGLIRELALVAQATLTLVTDSQLRVPPEAAEALEALGRGDAMRAVPKMVVLAARTSGIEIPVSVESSVKKALCATGASNPKGALGCFLLGPWADGVLFGLSGQVPVVQSGNLSVIGDAMLGYQWDQLGVLGRGAYNAWELESDDLIEFTYRGGGEVEGWWTTPKTSTHRLETRANAQVYGYESTKADSGGGGALTYETSVLVRGTLNLAWRIEPRAPWALGIWAGGGFQFESYSALGGYGNQTATESQTTSNNYILQGRIRGQWEAVPRWLVARARVDASQFRITRDAVTETLSADGSRTVERAVNSVQTEVYGRIFLDAEVLRFAGFVPSLNGGFDYSRRFDVAVTEDLVPVVGIGFRRIAY